MKEENFISPNYKGKVYYQLPFIDSYMESNEWKMFTVLFNHIMTVTKHDSIKTKPIEMTHQWLGMKVDKSEKTSQRWVASLCELGVIKVKQVDYKSNKYELNWDVINTLAQCQLDGKDKSVALTEVKNVSYIEDIFVPRTEDRNVPQRIKKKKTYNKNNNKGITKPTGTNTKSVRVSASELGDIPNKVFSSAEGNRLAKARNKSNRGTNASAATHSPRRDEEEAQHNSNRASTTSAANSHSPIIGKTDEAANIHNLHSADALATSHPQVAPTPLSPREQSAIDHCNKYYNNGYKFDSPTIKEAIEKCNNLLTEGAYTWKESTISKLNNTKDYLQAGYDIGYFF